MVAVAPVFGVTVYILFGIPRVKRKEREFIQKSAECLSPYLRCSDEERKTISSSLGRWGGMENYLSRAAYMHGYLNSETKFYPSGEVMFQDFIVELERAEKYIFMEYFIIDPGIMWDTIHKILVQKVKEGVEVRLLYDDIGSMFALRSGYYRKLRKEGINCYKFNKLLPFVSGIYNNRDHRKITVIDGKVAFTGGINIGDEYINENHRLGYWKDTAIRVKGEAVNNLLGLFFMNFDSTSREISEYSNYFYTEHETYENGGYIHPFGDGPKPYYQEQVGENNFINLISEAKKSVWITTPYLIIDYNLSTALRCAAARGVDVRIITPHVPDKKLVYCVTRSYYKPLLEMGVKIYEYTPGFIHAKMAIADGEMAFLGTINLDYRSLTHHYECGAVISGNECVKEIEKDFLDIFAHSEQVPEDFQMKFSARFLKVFLKIFELMF